MKITMQWQKFLNGKWQKEMPIKPGNYPIADRLGNDAGYNLIILNKGKPESIKNWQGWWWSEPQPPLLRPFEKWDNES